MINLSKCKFGDRFKTKGGRMAIFLHKSFVCHEVYICAIERDKYSHLEMKYLSDGERYYDNMPSEFDITGRWEENPIVEILHRGSSLIIKNNEGTINIS